VVNPPAMGRGRTVEEVGCSSTGNVKGVDGSIDLFYSGSPAHGMVLSPSFQNGI
jgi:hypothetical protein